MTETSTPPDGDQAPPTFDVLPLSDEVRRALAEMDYQNPTPVQTAVWKSVAEGKDVVVQARTGTGKTTAFGLPLVDRLTRPDQAAPQALILTPTRELALQVARELTRLGEHKGIETLAIYGGAPIGKQIDAIAAGAQIISGTPGRVLDHLRRRTLDPKTIRALVLDESDEMLSMGFERELTSIIERLPEERQTLLFSATVPPDIERMAKTRLKDPEFVILSSDQVGALEIVHFIYWVHDDKIAALKQVLDQEDPDSAIIFCNTRGATKAVASALQQEGFEADWLNGDLPQADREKVMKATREERLRFLVATDVAARGIDISHLTHVINYDFPMDAETYVHRTGRTGRAGRTGTALSLVTPREVGSLYMLRLTYKIRPVERELPSALEQQSRAETDVVHALAETFAARANEEYRSLARRLLTADDAELVIAGMLRSHLDTDPELPERAESRRRGRVPPRVEEPEEERKPRKKKKKARPADDEKDEKKTKKKGDKKRSDRKTGDERKSAPEAEAAADAPVEEEVVAVPDELPEGDEPPRRRKRAKKRGRSTKKADDETKASEVKASEADDGDSDAGDSDAGDGEAPRSSSRGDDDALPDDVIELHLDVGRRDGAKVRMLKSILADGGIGVDRVHRVRIRERYAFVEVDAEVSDEAIELFGGAQVGDRDVTAQLSKRSRA